MHNLEVVYFQGPRPVTQASLRGYWAEKAVPPANRPEKAKGSLQEKKKKR